MSLNEIVTIVSTKDLVGLSLFSKRPSNKYVITPMAPPKAIPCGISMSEKKKNGMQSITNPIVMMADQIATLYSVFNCPYQSFICYLT